MATEVIAGRFELIEHIAQGGSGSVWVARDLQHSKRCAAKVMRQSYSGEILRFVREQGVKFEHPNLLTPYGWAAVDDRVVIASELMRGGTLHTAMQDYGAFSTELVAEILTQLLDGLDHVHAAGWVHRDVKPVNVLLELTHTGVPRVRLTDFGIAAHQDAPRLTELGMTVGTDGYLAPQQRAGAGPEPAQDLYALGVLGMQLLDPLLAGDQLRERSAAVAANSLLVPPPLGTVLSGLLSDDPRVREQAASDAEQKLRPLRNPRGYHVASGEIFEVFDHFAENGDGAAEQSGGPATDALPGPHPEAGTGLSARPAVPSSGVPQPVPPHDAKPASARRGARWAPWLLLVVALAVGGLALWLLLGSPGDGGSSSGVPASSTEASPVASLDAAGADAVGQRAATVAPPATPSAAPGDPAVPTAPEPSPEGTALDVAISSTAREGQDCTALERGLTVSGADGNTLRCAPDGAGYAWTAVD